MATSPDREDPSRIGRVRRQGPAESAARGAAQAESQPVPRGAAVVTGEVGRREVRPGGDQRDVDDVMVGRAYRRGVDAPPAIRPRQLGRGLRRQRELCPRVRVIGRLEQPGPIEGVEMVWSVGSTTANRPQAAPAGRIGGSGTGCQAALASSLRSSASAVSANSAPLVGANSHRTGPATPVDCQSAGGPGSAPPSSSWARAGVADVASSATRTNTQSQAGSTREQSRALASSAGLVGNDITSSTG